MVRWPGLYAVLATAGQSALGGSMQLRRVVRESRATGVALAALGVFWGGFAAQMPVFKLRAGVSDAGLGGLLLLSALGGMAAMAAGPRLQRALGARALPLFGVVLAGAALMPLVIGSAVGLGCALLLMGAAMSSLDIAANVRISQREAETDLPLMNWNHALFSFGFGAAAVAAGLARAAGAPPEVIQPVFALILAGAALAMRDAASSDLAIGGPIATAQTLPVSPWGAVLPAAFILFAAFVAENATETWSALHIERDLGGAIGTGAFGPAMLGGMMGLGRLGGQMLAARLGEARLIAWSAMVGVVGAVVVAVAPVAWLAVLGVALIGAGVAVVVPSANSLLGRKVAPDARAWAISRAWLLGFTGFFIGPVVMGTIAQRAGLSVAFLAVALVLAAILPGLARLLRRAPQRRMPQL